MSRVSVVVPAAIVAFQSTQLPYILGTPGIEPVESYRTSLSALTVVITTVAPALSLTRLSATTIAPAATETIVNVPLLLADHATVTCVPCRKFAVTKPFPESAIVLVPAANEIVVAVFVEPFDVSY